MKTGRKIKKNSIEMAILFALAGGCLILSPMGGKVVVGLALYYFKKWWDKDGPYIPPEKDPEQIRQSIYKLKRNNYVKWKYSKKKNIIRLELTSKGRKIFGDMQYNDITVITPKNWDCQWHFLLFDIPEKSKSLRETLREKLKNIGFFQLQKSVWVYPFECEKEMRFICEFLGATAFVMMFTAKIANDKILRKYFYDRGILPRSYLDPRTRYLRS